MKPLSVTSHDFFSLLRWIDGRPLLEVIEPYRRRIFRAVLDTFDETAGRPQYNQALMGRAKKNWKSADLVLAALYSLVANDSPGGNQCYLVANDEDQAADDLALAKNLIDANAELLGRWLTVRQKIIERTDGQGFLKILPAQDVVGAHGKTYRFCGFDEIHGYRNWDLLEAMQLDPHRLDALMWITSYASLYHKPGVPLFDLTRLGKAGSDPRLFFSWYAGDYTTDPSLADADPETRANPSRGSWEDSSYLEQQRRRLPAHKYRRLHLNLPGLPEGSAYQVDPIDAAIERGVVVRPPQDGLPYSMFVDMSGGSDDDATAAIAHEVGERRVLDAVLNQGSRPPFDPRHAIARFVATAREYRVTRVRGDHYAGQTFARDFQGAGLRYDVSKLSKHQLYEAFEPLLNGGRVRLLDVPLLEQQLLGLGWRGGKIDHPAGEHDDWANAAVGALVMAQGASSTFSIHVVSIKPPITWTPMRF